MLRKLLLAFVCSAALSTPVFAQNLLTNPNFENGVNSWSINGPNWTPQNQVVKEGQISSQNTIGTIPSLDYFASLYQEVPASANQQFWATLQAKTNINVRARARAGVLLEFLNSANAVISSVQDETGGVTDWRLMYATAVAPAGTTRVRYRVFVFAPQSETQAGGIAVGGLTYFDEAVLSTTAIAPPPAPVFLRNPSFENGLVDWSLIYSPSFVVDDQNPSQGSFSAKSTIDMTALPNQDFFSAAYQDLQYQAGPVYASAQVRTAINPVSSGLAQLKLEFYNSNNIQIGSAQQTLTGNNPWTRLVLDGGGSGILPPGGTVKVRVMVLTFAVQGNLAANGGVANFDDVVLSYAPLPPQFRTTLLNGNFENGLNGWSDQFGFPSATTSNPVHGGSLAARKTIGVLQPPQNYYSQLYQDIYFNAAGAPWPVNTPVYATAYVKTNMNPTTKSSAGLQFEFIDAAGAVIRDANNVPIVILSKVGGQTDWRYLYITARTPANTVRVRVSGIEFARQQDANAAGTAYYDDFVFSRTFLTPPPAKTAYANDGFENGLNDWDELFKPGEVSSLIRHSGNLAAEFTIDNNVLFAQDYFGTATQDFYLKGRNVTVAGWVRTNIDPLTPSVAGIVLIFLDSSGNPVGPVQVRSVGGASPWTYLKFRATVPAGAKMVRGGFFLFGPGGIATPGDTAQFDDAIIDIR